MENKQKTKVTENVKEVKPVEKSIKPIEQPKVLKFRNPGKAIKIKLVDGKKFKWITLKTGEVVTLPRKIALRNQLVEVK